MTEKERTYIDKLRADLRVSVNSWRNGVAGVMNYHGGEMWYQFIKYWVKEDEANYGPEVPEYDRNTDNCPIISKGVISYYCWMYGKDEKYIFEMYYQRCLKKFNEIEAKRAGGSMRDLDAEFYLIHIQEEIERVSYSQKLRSYILDDVIENFSSSIQTIHTIEGMHFSHRFIGMYKIKR